MGLLRDVAETGISRLVNRMKGRGNVRQAGTVTEDDGTHPVMLDYGPPKREEDLTGGARKRSNRKSRG